MELPSVESIKLEDTVAPDMELPSVESIKLEETVPDKADTLTLDSLPYELLLLVFYYVDAGHLVKSVSKVCQKFHLLLMSETYWKTRLTAWYRPDRYPPVSEVSEDFDWLKACLCTEEAYSLWKPNSDKKEHIRIGNMVSGFTDALHFMQDGQLLLSGSRDHTLIVMDLNKIEKDQPSTHKDAVVFSDDKQHEGWVWCLNSSDDKFCSGCWDSKIRLWDTTTMSLVSTYRCNSAVLDIYMEPNLIISVNHLRTMSTIDTREGHVHTVTLHQKPVLCLAVTNKYIITGSEDGNICIYDRKAGAVYKKLNFNFYPMSMAYSDNHLWVGDHVGNLKLIDATNDKFNFVTSYYLGPESRQVTAIRHSMGALFTSSNQRRNGVVRIFEPTANLHQISTISPSLGEIPTELRKNYKRATNDDLEKLNTEASYIMQELGIGNRTQPFIPRKPKINLKDHKRNFEIELPVRLIVPSKSDLGILSKNILDRIIPHNLRKYLI